LRVQRLELRRAILDLLGLGQNGVELRKLASIEAHVLLQRSELLVDLQTVTVGLGQRAGQGELIAHCN